MGQHLDSHLLEQCLGHGPYGCASRGLPGTCSLEHVSGVVKVVLEHPGKVGVAGPGSSELTTARLALDRHYVRPLRPFAVAYEHRQGASECATAPHPGHDLERILLYLHAGAASVAVTSASELVADVLERNGQPGRKPLENRYERGPVRFAGCEITQSSHPAILAPATGDPLLSKLGPPPAEAGSGNSSDRLLEKRGEFRRGGSLVLVL